MKKFITHFFFTSIISIIILLTIPVFAAASTIIELNNKIGSYALTDEIQYYEDKSSTLKIADISSPAFSTKFKNNTKNIFNVGFSKSAYWLKLQFKVVASKSEKQKWLIVLGYPMLDFIDFYIPSKNIQIHSGDMLPFTHRKIKNNEFLFNIEFNRNKALTVFFKIRSKGSIQVPITVKTSSEFISSQQIKLLLYGIFYGIMIIFIMYNLIFYTVIRDKSY